MARRMIVMLAVTGLLLTGLGFVKFQQIQTAIAQGAAFQPPPEAVTTIVTQEEQWPATLRAIGTMAAVQGVTVSADLAGTVDRILFDSGQAVREGAVLAVLDTRQEKAQLAAIEAQRELARLTFERMEGLLNERVISRAEFDRATADQRQTEAHAGEIRATIERKTIRAPFSGILGLRQVNLGQYLSAGDALVSLEALDPVYVNFGVPQQASGQMQRGRSTVRQAATSPDASPPSTPSSIPIPATSRSRQRWPTPVRGCVRVCSSRPTSRSASRKPSWLCRHPRSTTHHTEIRSSSWPTSRVKTAASTRARASSS